MSSKAMWEVDPETRSKLQEIQKSNGNDRCADCNAPSPQWASPKFGVFICLSCAGVHRGLGVHISFVRSITMDAFKSMEIERMRSGGNKTWREFFDSDERNVMAGITWDDATIAERYSGEVGEEYRDRLSAKIEKRVYVASSTSRSQTPLSTSRTNSPSVSAAPNTAPAGGPGGGGKVKVDDKYFANLGSANAARPDDLPPSQGGKYSGFGSAGPEPVSSSGTGKGGLPGFEDLQKDPVAALTKGFGWFTTTVGKTAKSVNEGYIQPTANKISETEFASQARMTAVQVGKGVQSGARNAADGFNRFVEGNGGEGTGARRQAPLDESKKDFWDSFADAGNARNSGGGGSGNIGPDGAGEGGSSAIGTSAVKKSGTAGGPAKKKDDEWGEW